MQYTKEIVSLVRLSRAQQQEIQTKYFKADTAAVFFGDSVLVLKPNGKVEYLGTDEAMYSIVSGWKFIIKIVAGANHAVAMDYKGRLFSVGDNTFGQCDVNFWNNVIDVFAKGDCTIAVSEDYSICVAGIIRTAVQNHDRFDVGISYPIDEIITRLGELESRQDIHESQLVQSLQNNGERFAANYSPAVYHISETDIGENILFSPKQRIITVAAGNEFSLGVHEDGSVTGFGDNLFGECSFLSRWRNIIQICAGLSHTVALKKNGIVVATGDGKNGQCNVKRWRKIAMISAGDKHTVGLDVYGEVFASGDNSYGQCDVKNVDNIIKIAAGSYHTLALNSSGIVFAFGNHKYGQCDMPTGIMVKDISAGRLHSVLLKNDGTVAAVGLDRDGQCDVEDWRDIVCISAGADHTVGVKNDGTVVAVGRNDHGQCNVEDWKDIKYVSAGYTHTLGIKTDGTVITTRHEPGKRWN